MAGLRRNVCLELILREAEKVQDPLRGELLAVAAQQGSKEVVAAVEVRLVSTAAPGRQAVGWQLAFELPSAFRQPYLERAITSGGPMIRNAALQRYLEALPEAPTPPPLLLELARDSNEAVRSKVLQALEKYSTPDVMALMVERFVRDVPPLEEPRAGLPEAHGDDAP